MVKRSKSNLNMREIAKLAGVSPATVSRVLNGRCDGKTETHDRVRDVLRANGYERKKRIPPKATIVCVNEYDEEHLTSHSLRILSRLDEIASLNQCELLTIHTADVGRITRKLADPRVSGAIYMGDVLSREIDKPSVVLNRYAVNETHSSVDCDDMTGLVMLFRHLRSAGHERVAYFSDTLFNANSKLPRKSFDVMKAFAMAGVGNPKIWNFALKPGNENAVFTEIANEFKAIPVEVRPTVLALCGDTYAPFAYKVFSDCGIRVPIDLSVAGFDDEPFSNRLSPRLTTVAKPIDEMCETAFKLLLTAIRDKTTPTQRIFIKPELILRDSVRKI